MGAKMNLFYVGKSGIARDEAPYVGNCSSPDILAKKIIVYSPACQKGKKLRQICKNLTKSLVPST